MESWTYILEERSYLFSDEIDFSLDALMRSRKSLVEWENKSSCNFEGEEFNSDDVLVNNMEFIDLVFPEFLQKSSRSSKPMETSGTVHGSVQTTSCELDSNSSSKRGNSFTHVIAFDSSFGEEDSESKHLSSPVKLKNHDSPLIDFKLGRLTNCQGARSDTDAKEFTSTAMPHIAYAIRVRTSSLPAEAPLCQVYGCNIDLSSSKDYHKRHKVCDVHSKTPKVIVNGIEQRFCQQCSKFHLVAEFDDGKRSCRRRLAGHNERRRKPQFDYMTSKQHKMLQLYQAGNPLPTSGTFLDIRTQDIDDQVSETPFRISFIDKHEENESFPCGINSMEVIENGGVAVDLFQLSSHLQMVEQQKNYVLVKWENEDCSFPTM